jgi:hypothetical protein
MMSRVLVPLDGGPTMARSSPGSDSGLGAPERSFTCWWCVLQSGRFCGWRTGSFTWMSWSNRSALPGSTTCSARGSPLAYDGVVVRREVRFGDPVAESLAAAERHTVQLIALVGQPQSWLRRLVRPTLAEQLLARSRVPVLVVPPVSYPATRLVLRYSGIRG